MSIEAVEELLLDTEEAIAHQKEIGEMLSQKLSDEDEEDILKELESLTADEVPPSPYLDFPLPTFYHITSKKFKPTLLSPIPFLF